MWGRVLVTSAPRRGRVLMVGVVLAALTGSLGRADPGAPVLRWAAARGGHVIVTFRVGDLRPGSIEVAVSGVTDARGRFLTRNVRLREAVSAQPDPVTGIVSWRTSGRLPARTYAVQVSGIESDGVTDCLPQLRDCLVHWSNVRRVSVR